jgi:quinol-cytochrome oxidoreductase complex cytochrome b subunit
MLGGEDISHDTLLRTFSFHAGILPVLMLLLASQHLWRIRKSGGLAGPQETDEDKLPSSPWLYRAELSVVLLTLSALLMLALVVQAPLAERADPLHPPNPAKAQWYFVGIQEMVSHSAMIGGVIVPALIGFFLVFAPMLDRSASAGGRWFSRDRWIINLSFALILLSQLMFIAIGEWFRTKDWMFHFPF